MKWFRDLKHRGKPSLKEWKHFTVTIIILTFIIGFNDNNPNSTWYSFIINMIYCLVFISISIFMANFAGKLFASINGYDSEYSFSINGLLVGVLIAFVSNGLIWILQPGQLILHLNQAGRLGKFRYNFRMRDWARSALMIPLAHTLLAILGHISAPGNEIAKLFVNINLWLALFSVLPIPHNNGINIFFGENKWTFLITPFIIGVMIAIRFTVDLYLIILLALLIAITVFYLFHKKGYVVKGGGN